MGGAHADTGRTCTFHTERPCLSGHWTPSCCEATVPTTKPPRCLKATLQTKLNNLLITNWISVNYITFVRKSVLREELSWYSVPKSCTSKPNWTVSLSGNVTLVVQSVDALVDPAVGWRQFRQKKLLGTHIQTLLQVLDQKIKAEIGNKRKDPHTVCPSNLNRQRFDHVIVFSQQSVIIAWRRSRFRPSKSYKHRWTPNKTGPV